MAKKVLKSNKTNSDSKLFAFLAVFLTVIGFLVALLVKRDDEYIMFYAKQGLVLFIVGLIAKIAFWLPFIGDVVGVAVAILFVIVWIAAWINALSGEKRNTFLVGDFARKIRL